MYVRGLVWGSIAIAVALVACGGGTSEPEESLGRSSEALTAAQSRVLGFEAPLTDWQKSGGTLSSSTTRSQGSASLGIIPNGWTELTSVQLSSLGDVGSTFRYDVRVPTLPIWGETRAIVSVPSRGIYWAELGSKDLRALPVGSFQPVSFAIPAALEAVLDGAYSDLTIKIVVNAQALSQPYLIDNVVLTTGSGGGGSGGASGAGGSATAGTGGAAGGGGTAGAGGAGGGGGTGGGIIRQFSILRPTGVTLENTFISATDHLSFLSQSTLGQSGKTPALASFGGTINTYLQSSTRAFGNVYSVPNVQLDAKTRVDGAVRTRGTIGKQGVGADKPVVTGGEFVNQNVLPVVMSWSVQEPSSNAGDVEFPATTTVQDHVLAPGSYGRFNIQDRHRVFLSSGTYFFQSFNTEPLAEVRVDKTNGPIVIYVRDSFTYKGPLVENGGPVGRTLVGYSGSSDAFLQAPFRGTIVAPSATIKLERPTSGQHRGSFFGKAVEVASGPHTVLHEPFDFQFLCARGDTDRDGTSDCTDICNLDPAKVTPGMCGCGQSEVDTDGDRVPDCIDQCPLDASAQFRGTCGCPSAPAPDGTACFDSACRGKFSCNAGVCGNSSSCKPAPSCQLRYLATTRHYYWFCNAPVSWEQARNLCSSADGSKLVEIDGDVENGFVANNVSGFTAWSGANDRSTEGEWFWNGFATDSGDKFWTGGAAGKRYFARYSAWSGGSPPSGAASCGTVASGGLWTGQPCNALNGFVCELGLDRTGGIDFPVIDPTCEVLGIGCEPGEPGTPGVDCTSEADAFGGLSEGQVLDAFSNCQAACADGKQDTPECAAACSGPATPPAMGATCADAADFPRSTDNDSCGASTVLPGPIPCNVADDCPANQGAVCSREYPGGGPTQPRLCVVPSNDCAVEPTFPDRCSEVVLCEPDNEQTVTTVEGPGANLTEQPFVPSEAFGPETVAPSTPYARDDDPCGGSCVGRGQSHPWCHLGPADETPPRPPVSPARHGDTGGDLISFHFDPKFTLNHSANIGAFGLPKLDVKAEAGVSAGVSVNIPGVPNFDIINLLVSLEADQCGISKSEQTADILGKDFIALADLGEFGLPIQLPSPATRKACEDAYSAFEDAGNRAKKALRDAVEILQQYKAKIQDDVAGQPATFANNLRSDLCRQIAASVPRGFPPGNCPATGTTESPEATINRFIDYYRRSLLGFGQPGIKGLTEVASDLKNAAKAHSTDVAFTIFSYENTEEDTIASAQFFIGPIPVFLDVISTVQYGANIKGRAGFNAGPVVDAILQSDTDMPAEQVAYAGVEGSPYAGAGLGLFAGVGFGVPGFKVKIGMAADLHLGTVYLPAYAGAGIGLGAEIDGRPAPADLGPLSTGINLIPAKRFVADLRFTAGLGVKVRDILNGSISGKLKISVLFFSKSWRKTLFSFKGICAGDPNTPMPGCDFDLITFNGSTDAATGSFPWAEIRMPTPFPQLAQLTANAATPGTQSVDLAKVEELFFDGECDCIDGTDTTEKRVCVRNADCCDNTPVCFTDPVTGGNSCIECRHRGETCNEDVDCCGSPNTVCNTTTKKCEGKLSCSEGCTRDDECVDGQSCVPQDGKVKCWVFKSPCVIF